MAANRDSQFLPLVGQDRAGECVPGLGITPWPEWQTLGTSDCLPIATSAECNLETKQEGKIEMGGDIEALSSERDRIENELTRLDERQVTLEKERAEITRKTEAAAGDTESLAQLKIETEQAAEAKRMNDRLIAQTAKRLKEVENIIVMQQQSDMT